MPLAPPGGRPGEEHRTVGAPPSMALSETRSLEFGCTGIPPKERWDSRP